MTQAEVADALKGRGLSGIYPQTVTKIEAGQRALRFIEALELAALFSVEPRALNQLTTADINAWHLKQDVDHAMGVMRAAEEALYNLEGARIGIEEAVRTTQETASNRSLLAMARGILDQTSEKLLERARVRHAHEEATDALRQEMGASLTVDELMSHLWSETDSKRGEGAEEMDVLTPTDDEAADSQDQAPKKRTRG